MRQDDNTIAFYRMKLGWRLVYLFVLPLFGVLLWGSGVGVTREHLVLKGFGTKYIPWTQVDSLTQGALTIPFGGAAVALVANLVIKAPLFLRRKDKGGVWSVPVNQTENPHELLANITERIAAVV